jgi:hypothetical protein
VRFLADESCDFAVVRALRANGHDVLSVAEVASGSSDDVVIELAVREARVLLTEDKDFGQLVFAHGHPSAGVLLMRFPSRHRAALPQTVVDVVARQGGSLARCFAVVQPGRVRLSYP